LGFSPPGISCVETSVTSIWPVFSLKSAIHRGVFCSLTFWKNPEVRKSCPTIYSGACSGSWIADRRWARSSDQICIYEKTFPFATCCKFEKIPWNEVLSIFHIRHDGWTF
jgi:hypothetical protein